MSAPTIQPIQTTYAGCRFRSRLEARWAVFFDHLGIEWRYEPEGFLVGTDNRPYLPDFWLPVQKIWLEVKGTSDSDGIDLWYDFCEIADPSAIATAEHEGRKTRPLADDMQGTCLLAYGDIPQSAAPQWAPHHDSMLTYNDSYYLWCRCDRCGLIGAQYDGRIERLSCRCHFKGDAPGIDIRNYGDRALTSAFTAARSARFEHRERRDEITATLSDRVNSCLLQFDISTAEGRVAALRKVAPLIAEEATGDNDAILFADLMAIDLNLDQDAVRRAVMYAYRSMSAGADR